MKVGWDGALLMKTLCLTCALGVPFESIALFRQRQQLKLQRIHGNRMFKCFLFSSIMLTVHM